ncbi:MAG: uracil-DNA glycosylase, partial [Terriglobales bacterium]
MPAPTWLEVLNVEVVACTRCPRLVEYRERIAREKRRAYRDCEYWGKPVPGFGDPRARVLVL